MCFGWRIAPLIAIRAFTGFMNYLLRERFYVFEYFKNFLSSFVPYICYAVLCWRLSK